MKGKIVPAVPPVTRHRSGYDWDSPAQLAKMTGQPVLAGERVPISRITAVRGYTRAPFRTPEGRIIIEMRNSSVDDDGHRVGDVYFTWAPTTTTKASK